MVVENQTIRAVVRIVFVQVFEQGNELAAPMPPFHSACHTSAVPGSRRAAESRNARAELLRRSTPASGRTGEMTPGTRLGPYEILAVSTRGTWSQWGDESALSEDRRVIQMDV